MRIIIHTDDPADAIMAHRAVNSAIKLGHDDVVFTYGGAPYYSVYVRKNKTGFTAYVTKKGAKEGEK